VGLSFALAAGALAAQQRQPLLGRVVDKDGAPVAAAKVTLVEDDADLAGIDPVDVVEATTDDKGRFVAHALRGVRYTALAIGAEHDGKAMVARPVPDLACGRVAELQLLQPGERQRGTLPELDRWGGSAALCVHVRFEHCPGYAIEVPIAADASVELPAIAAAGTACLGPRMGGTIALLDPFAAPRFALRMATLRVQVIDDKGALIEGARVAVQQKDSPFLTECARSPTAVTNREGRATLTFGTWSDDPLANPSDDLVVAATKAGCAEAGSGWVCKFPFVDWSWVAEHADATVRLVLHDQRPLRAAVTGAAVAGRKVRVLALGNMTADFGGFTGSFFVPRSYEVAIAADGAFAVPELPLSTSDVRLVVPPVDGRRVVLMPSHSATLNAVDLADCEPLSLQVLDAGRGPAAAAKVILVPFACDGRDLEHAPPIVLDQAGRVDVLLQHGRWQILAMDDANWAWLEVAEWRADAPITLQLAPMPGMRVRVLGPDGAPVAGARFEIGVFQPGMPGGPGQDRLLTELGWNAFADCVRRAETDARGDAVVRALPWPGVTTMLFAWCGDHDHRCPDVPFAPGDDVHELKLTR
jgi:hypothetical protein